jgi:hypothetical protein
VQLYTVFAFAIVNVQFATYRSRGK